MRNRMFVPGNTGFRGFFLVDLTPLAFSYCRVKHQKSPPYLLLKISVTLCKLALKSAIIHVKGS